jgi:hypothetical protein
LASLEATIRVIPEVVYSLGLSNLALTMNRSQHNPLDQDISFEQFANVDSPILAWHFLLHGRDGAALASIDRAFRGFGREVGLLKDLEVGY